MTSQRWLRGTGTTSWTAEKHFLQRPPVTLEWKRAALVTHLNLYCACKEQRLFLPVSWQYFGKCLAPKHCCSSVLWCSLPDLSAVCWCSPLLCLVTLSVNDGLFHWGATSRSSGKHSQKTPIQKANLLLAPNLRGFNEVLWRSSSYQGFIKDEDIFTNCSNSLARVVCENRSLPSHALNLNCWTSHSDHESKHGTDSSSFFCHDRRDLFCWGLCFPLSG